MKKNLFFPFLIAVGGLFFSGCDNFNCCMNSIIKISPASVEFVALGSESPEVIRITSSVPWRLVKPSDFPDWLTLSSESGDGSVEFTLSAGHNTSGAALKDYELVFLAANGDKALLTVNQDVILYKVGDYYPDPLDATTAEGMVFQLIDPVRVGGVGYASKGKIVSLVEGFEKKWDNGNHLTNARNSTDGRANMDTISNYLQQNGKTWADFPAFHWVVTEMNKKTDWSATDLWYLPAIDELQAVYSGMSGLNYGTDISWGNGHMPNYDLQAYAAARTSFNNKLAATSGKPIDLEADYWSSTEESKGNAFCMRFSGGLRSSGAKSYPRPVRAIRSF